MQRAGGGISGSVSLGITPPDVTSFTSTPISSVTGSNQQLVAASPGQQIWVYGFGFTATVAGTVSFQDSDDGALTGAMSIPASGGITNPPSTNPAMPIWKVPTGKALEVDVTTATINGWITYALVDAS